MSIDKSIANGREHRRPYYKKPQIVDKACRCHGTCEYCYDNRMHKNRKADEAIAQMVIDEIMGN